MSSSALAHQPSVTRNGPVPRPIACRSTMSRSATKPDTVSLSPATGSRRGVQERANRSAGEAAPRCAINSATTRSLPDSSRFTISSIASGECRKSACSVMAQSRLGRSVRASARRSNAARLAA